MQHTSAYTGKNGTVGYAMEIDKAGVAQHTVIGVEDEEREDIDDEAHTEAKRDLPKVLFQV